MKIKCEDSFKPVRRSITLDESVNNDLDLYSEIINSSPNYVVNKILSTFFAKDKDFQARKKNSPGPSTEVKSSSRKKDNSADDSAKS